MVEGTEVKTSAGNSSQRNLLLSGIWLLYLCLMLIATACGGRGEAAKPYASGGLGLTRAEWEQHHTLGAGRGEVGYKYDMKNKQWDTGYTVFFWSEQSDAPNDAIVSSLGVDTRDVFSDTQNLDWYEMVKQFPKMQAAVRFLMPADAQLVSTSNSERSHTTNEVYHSESLKNRYPTLPFSKVPWGGEAPGTIHVSYSGEVASSRAGILAGPGNILRLPTPPPPPTDTPLPTYPYAPPVPTSPLAVPTTNPHRLPTAVPSVQLPLP